jgi:dihydrofolate synthase/folylpolyglutamate synthase
MTYHEAIQFLYDLRWFGTKFGLGNTFKLAGLVGNPHHKLRFIHVAGTNGKGSTCAMLESIYRAARLRVGLFTSPHLVSFSERIQINREPISESDVVQTILELQPLLKEFPRDEHPTFFEVVTIMALRHFAAQNCDLVIWETGLGGRLDATNIVTPLASVITNIQFDHQQWLGETLPDIAAEKAGIIKPGVPVVTATSEPDALKVLRETARQLEAPLTTVSQTDTSIPPLDTIQLPLLGSHQRLNAALAAATARLLSRTLPINEGAIRSGLTQLDWPGRLQLVTRPSGQKILLDGAHNVAGAQNLSAALKDSFSSLRPTLIVGILQDKDWTGICRILAPLASRIFLVPVSSERTAKPEELQQPCQAHNPSAITVVCSTVAEALERTAEEPFVVITGSLYLVGEVLEILGVLPGRRTPERPLNEWSVKP